MSIVALFVAGIAVLPAFALATWLWLAVTRVHDEMSSFAGFEGMHLEG